MKNNSSKVMHNKSDFEKEFAQITGFYPVFDNEYESSLEKLIFYLNDREILPFEKRRSAFLSLINKKFDLNSRAIGTFYARAVKLGHTFNFHEKNTIQKAFDAANLEMFKSILEEKEFDQKDKRHLMDFFVPVSELETIQHVKKEVECPSKLRIDNDNRNVGNEILKALFSAFIWLSIPEKDLHRYFDREFSEKNYSNSFWEQLQKRTPTLFNRESALFVIKISKEMLNESNDAEALRNKLISAIPNLYQDLNNYGFLVFVIDSLTYDKSIEWELASDLILAAEKFNEIPLNKNYFHWERIRNETKKYIEALDEKSARFDLVNEGFTYRDTIVLEGANSEIERLLVVFQKNQRDETLIPCPSCRSSRVQGNSYSSLGVKSWECKNAFCPDRTKYNRGKRYSFKGLLMQSAIENDENIISPEIVRKWRKDVVQNANLEEVFSMIVRYYSMCGDTVHLYNWKIEKTDFIGRKIVKKDFQGHPVKSFFSSNIFKRYIVNKQKIPIKIKNIGDENFQVYQGDASIVLPNFSENIFDGAVTSPPYYNAREYSQWPNIYCYLYDMFNINKEVFRTLKPGALYLYNIFDYFDNENTVAYSAMGQKRMILSAYTVDLFRRIGFELVGNIVWDKGDIEGKRGFNAGNFSPFYQAPFNCWEHILLFAKPDIKNVPKLSSKVFKCKPVFKIVGGKNTHGHTAPYPDELPEILVRSLPSKSLILDPFAGSLTTGRSAEKWDIRSVNIEISKEYCELGLQKRKHRNLSLFEMINFDKKGDKSFRSVDVDAPTKFVKA